MRFIQKQVEKKRLEREQQLKNECSAYAIAGIENSIRRLKSLINKLSINKKDSGVDNLDILCEVEFIEEYYEKFLHDLKQEEFTYKHAYSKKIEDSAKQKIDYMHKLKKQYHVEFENIYNNFKRVTKGRNFPRRNELLGIMRKVFDFDSSKYYSNDDQFVLMR